LQRSRCHPPSPLLSFPAHCHQHNDLFVEN
jgi:hypothetical protein